MLEVSRTAIYTIRGKRFISSFSLTKRTEKKDLRDGFVFPRCCIWLCCSSRLYFVLSVCMSCLRLTDQWILIFIGLQNIGNPLPKVVIIMRDHNVLKVNPRQIEVESAPKWWFGLLFWEWNPLFFNNNFHCITDWFLIIMTRKRVASAILNGIQFWRLESKLICLARTD